MMTIDVSAGQTSTGLPLSSGDVMNVLSGGTSSDTLVLSGGTINVLSGGTADNTTLRAGGIEIVSSGGSDFGTTISSGGTEIALSNNSANAIADTVLSGGTLIVSSAGFVNSANVAGGSAIVSAGSIFQLATITGGGTVTVLAGDDFVGSNEVGAGGVLIVSSGASVQNTTLSSGGTEIVFGSASFQDVVLSGGLEIVSSGGVSHDTIVNSGGSEIVLTGGTAIAGEFNPNTYFGLTASGGTIEVLSSGTASGATVRGGLEVVSSGGRSVGTVLSAGGVEIVSSGGSDFGTTISSGGTEIALSNNSANAIADTVLSGGTLIVSSAGFVNSANVAGGSAIVSAGSIFQLATITGGGTVTVLAGDDFVGSNEVGASGVLIVSSGASVQNITLSSGGTEIVFGSASFQDVVLGGGLEIVSSGGISHDTIVNSGGSEIVLTGGTAIAGEFNPNTYFGLTASGGTIEVLSKGTTRGATVLNGGTEIVSAGGTAIVTTIGTSGSLDLLSGGIVSGAILFSGVSGTLAIGDPTPPTNPIGGFGAGANAIDLQNVIFFGNTSVSFNSATDQLTVTEGASSASLQLVAADYSGVTWTATSDIGGGTDVVVCFCRGTLIRTEDGEVPVEDLKIGDRVKTLSGAAKPIRWIGFGRDLVTRRNSLARPIVVRQGALADDVPRRDLYLTHGHSLYFDGALIPVENLVNHRSILWDDTARVVEYYHIELEDHDVVFAEGAPAESYCDAGNRAFFQNMRSGSEAGAARPSFAPVLTGGEVVERVWAALFERADGQIERATSDDPDLHLVIDGERLDPVSREDGLYTFALAAPPAAALVLRSRSAVPSLIGLNRHEHRRLGVAIRQIILHGPGVMTCFDHDGPVLAEGGCHGSESGHSWTDGALSLPAGLFAHLKGGFALLVHTSKQNMRYPIAAAVAQAA